MLGTRLVTGFSMAGLLIAILFFDEWLTPWFPLWLIVSLCAVGAAALELVRSDDSDDIGSDTRAQSSVDAKSS